jgi:ribosomal protein S20
MMEGVNLAAILEIVSKFGTLGVLVVVWWTDRKQMREQNESHRTDMAAMLKKYEHDMIEQRQMYDSNVKLVKAYESISSDLREVVIMNTQAVTEMCTDIQTNQYCPMVRLKKQAGGITE